MRARTQLHAFTLVEAMVALAIIAIVSALGFGGLTMANQYAMVARLYTVAEETARNQIDQIESATPYNPQLSQTPPVLTPGTTTSTVPLYVDPPTNTTVVSGTMTTVIASLGSYNGVTGTVTVTFSSPESQLHGRHEYDPRLRQPMQNSPLLQWFYLDRNDGDGGDRRHGRGFVLLGALRHHGAGGEKQRRGFFPSECAHPHQSRGAANPLVYFDPGAGGCELGFGQREQACVPASRINPRGGPGQRLDDRRTGAEKDPDHHGRAAHVHRSHRRLYTNAPAVGMRFLLPSFELEDNITAVTGSWPNFTVTLTNNISSGMAITTNGTSPIPSLLQLPFGADRQQRLPPVLPGYVEGHRDRGDGHHQRLRDEDREQHYDGDAVQRHLAATMRRSR